MLNIFADALLIVVGRLPQQLPPSRAYPSRLAEVQARRRWFSLLGIQM